MTSGLVIQVRLHEQHLLKRFEHLDGEQSACAAAVERKHAHTSMRWRTRDWRDCAPNSFMRVVTKRTQESDCR